MRELRKETETQSVFNYGEVGHSIRNERTPKGDGNYHFQLVSKLLKIG